MTAIHAGFSLNNPNIKPLDMSKAKLTHISEAPQDVFEHFTKAQESMLEARYSIMPDTSKNPTYKDYAKVVVNGKVVAQIDNHGWTKTSNALGARIGKNLPMEGQNGAIQGPELAQARAEYIAEMLGGTVEIADTALTQNQFRAIPQPEVTVDYAAMRQDPLYEQLQKTKQARTEFLAQQIAQETPEESTPIIESQEEQATEEPSAYQTAAEEFLDYMSKTPEERYFEAILAEKGLTKEQLDALPPEEKAKILEEIKEEIKKRMITDAVERNKKQQQEA